MGKINQKIKVVDLFAGVGGFSEGFIKNGCEVVAHVEMNKDACSTLETRAIYHALKKKKKIHQYIRYVKGNITKEALVEKYELQDEIKTVICEELTVRNTNSVIDRILKLTKGDKPDIIIGGPPCQAYSYIGRSRDKNKMAGDKRNYLYRLYIKFLKRLEPKIFLFENVPGLLTAGNGKYLKVMRESMKRVGYETDFRVLDASDYGVPQMRKRVILIGWNKKSGIKSYPEFEKVIREYKVKDFLNGFPKLNAGEELKIKKQKVNKGILFDLGIIDNDFGYIVNHVTRPHNSRDLEIYKIAVKKMLDNKPILKYNELPVELKSHKNENGFLDRYKVVNPKSKASQTVVAHIAKDGHYYIHPDIKQNRSLSVREAARLQTFPDNFIFEESRSSKFRQIGNAVPPLLSDVISKKIIEII